MHIICDYCHTLLHTRNARRLGDIWACPHCATTAAIEVLSSSGDPHLVGEALDLLRAVQGVEHGAQAVA